jgi:NitT/TauT family transport system permease protein
MIYHNSLLSDVCYTFIRTTIGFIIACIIGIPFGLLMGYSKIIYNSFEFTINFFRNIPATALFPLFIIIFGIGEKSKIAISFWVSLWILIINAVAGVRSSKKLRLSAAKLLQISKRSLLKKIIFFEALPQIFTGMRVGYSLAFIVIIVTEMSIGSNYGLGRRIIDAQLIYKTDELYAAIIVSGLMGLVINQLFLSLEKRLIFWQGK